jgi:hypothetical protein
MSIPPVPLQSFERSSSNSSGAQAGLPITGRAPILSFRRWLSDTTFGLTYHAATA